MKKYETPEVIVTDLEINNIIASTFAEGDSDNETGWLDKWTSGITNQG